METSKRKQQAIGKKPLVVKAMHLPIVAKVKLLNHKLKQLVVM